MVNADLKSGEFLSCREGSTHRPPSRAVSRNRTGEELAVAGMLCAAATTRQEPRLGLSRSASRSTNSNAADGRTLLPREYEQLAQSVIIARARLYRPASM
jgi:hypothetical protein